MEKKEMIKDVVIQVISALLIQIILQGAFFGVSLLSKEKISITVCTSTPNSTGYSTSINFKNYQNDKSISEIIIWSDAGIDSNLINYYNYDVFDNRIILHNIPPLYDETIVFNSPKKIDENNTRFETEEKVTVSFIHNQKENVYSYWKNVVIDCLMYMIIYIFMIICVYCITEKRIELQQERIEQLEKDEAEIKEKSELVHKRLDEKEKEIIRINEGQLKLKIFLHRKLEDYAKELDFYKNLVKNIVNTNSNREDICYMITKELKTFKTLEKINAEDLEIDSLTLSEIEKEDIKKGL